MVITSNTPTEFILVSKDNFQDRAKPVNLSSTTQAYGPIKTPETTAPQNDSVLSKVPSAKEEPTLSDTNHPQHTIKTHVITELEKIYRKPYLKESKTWSNVDTILDAVLASKSVDIQSSNLLLTVDGNVIKGLSIQNFIYDLLHYNKRIPVPEYSLVLQNIQIPRGIIKNRFAKQIAATTDFQDNTTNQIGSGVGAEVNGGKEEDRGYKQKNRTYASKNIKKNSRWITL